MERPEPGTPVTAALAAPPAAPTPGWRQHAGADLIAGVSIAGLLLPEAVAYSGIGNLPPQAGVIALFAGLVPYALLGRSRFAIVSATSSSAAIVAATTASMAAGDAPLRLAMAAAFVLLAGAVFLLASLMRLGNATDFIAKPVLRGFTFGLAIVIILKQLPLVLGVKAAGSNLVLFGWQLGEQWRHWNPFDLAIGVASLLLLKLCGRWRRVPGALLVIALGVIVNHVFDLHGRQGIEVVGTIHLDAVRLALPTLTFDQWQRLAEVAVALVLVLYSESSGSIRSLALKYGDPVTPNRDLCALGIANLCSGLLQGMPVGAGYSASSANEAAGAQSRLSGLFAAATVLLLILTVLPWVALTPAAALAAIVIHAVGHTLNPAVFRPYFRWQRDRLVAVIAVLAVFSLGVLDGLLLAVAISVAMALRGFAQDTVAELRRHANGHDFVDARRDPDSTAVPGVLVLRPSSPVFFANADRIFAHVRELRSAAGAPTVVLSLEETPDIDGTTIEALTGLARDIQGSGGRLLLARLKPPILDALARAGVPELAEPAVSYFSVDDAVSAAQAGAGR